MAAWLLGMEVQGGLGLCIETIGVSLAGLFLLNYRYLHNSLSFNFLKSLPSQVGRRGKKNQGHTIATQYSMIIAGGHLC